MTYKKFILSASLLLAGGVSVNSAMAFGSTDTQYHIHVRNGVIAANAKNSPGLVFQYYATADDKSACFVTPEINPETWRDDYTGGNCKAIDHVIVAIKNNTENAYVNPDSGPLRINLAYGTGQINYDITVVADKQPTFNPDGTLNKSGNIKLKDGSGPWLTARN